MTDLTTVGCKVDRETHERLKRLAHERYTTVSDLLRDEIDELLADADEVEHPEPTTVEE